jgi:hypothetical protein
VFRVGVFVSFDFFTSQSLTCDTDSVMIEIGKAYLFHTHLGIWLGRVRLVDPDEVCLDECSWIPDQGRMSECVAKGTLTEVEPVGDGVIVPRTAIKVPWKHPLPKKAK